jgi:hypothetical protein
MTLCPVIISYGNSLYFQHGHESHRRQYVSQKLRQLGRFLIAARSLDNSAHSLRDCLQSSQFEIVVPAVIIVAGFDDSTHLYKVPSLPLKLGIHRMTVLTCCALKQDRQMTRQAIRQQNSSFSCTRCYGRNVFPLALRTMTLRRMQASLTLPLAEDLQKLQSYLQDSVAKGLAALE